MVCAILAVPPVKKLPVALTLANAGELVGTIDAVAGTLSERLTCPSAAILEVHVCTLVEPVQVKPVPLAVPSCTCGGALRLMLTPSQARFGPDSVWFKM